MGSHQRHVASLLVSFKWPKEKRHSKSIKHEILDFFFRYKVVPVSGMVKVLRDADDTNTVNLGR